MAVRHQIVVKSPAGTRLGLLTGEDALGFNYVREVNGVGAFTLLMSGEHALVSSFADGGQVEFWREDPQNSIPRYKDAEFLVDDLLESFVDGQQQFQVSGVGYNGMLARRVIAAYAGSAQAEKTGKAETVLKAFVNEQIVSAVLAARQITGLTIQADAASGNTIATYGAWQPLLDIAKVIAGSGGGDFQVVGTGDGTYELRWYFGQLGTDRRATVIFALNFGNMKDPTWEVRRSDTINAVLVAGQGQETDRATVWALTGTPSGATRREFFVDARDEATTAGLTTRGNAKLDESKQSAYFDFLTVQTAALQYGRDYFLGDLVTARYLSHQEYRKIARVAVTGVRGMPEVLELGTVSIA